MGARSDFDFVFEKNKEFFLPTNNNSHSSFTLQR